LPPLKTDEDNFDFLNAFFDLKIAEIDGKPVYLRAGRQELLFGSERFVTPLEWANTRQTFQERMSCGPMGHSISMPSGSNP